MTGKNNIYQQTQQKKIKGKADVMFVIDSSPSMKPIFSGLKKNIKKFIESLKQTQKLSYLDLRFGIIAHDWKKFQVLDFTKDIEQFKQALDNIETKNEEYTLPALDRALDSDWRVATRIVVVFTDEKLGTNHSPDLQKSKLNEVMKKIAKKHINLYFVGLKCAEYEKLIQFTPNTNGSLFKNKKEFLDYDFPGLVKDMGKTLSSSLLQMTENASDAEEDLFNTKNKIRQENLLNNEMSQ